MSSAFDDVYGPAPSLDLRFGLRRSLCGPCTVMSLMVLPKRWRPDSEVSPDGRFVPKDAVCDSVAF